MNPISQDDQFMYSKQNEIALSFIPTSKLQKKEHPILICVSMFGIFSFLCLFI